VSQFMQVRQGSSSQIAMRLKHLRYPGGIGNVSELLPPIAGKATGIFNSRVPERTSS